MAYQIQRQTHGQALSSEIQVQALREELDAANKKADRYVHLVGTLYEELDNLRRSICHNCKKQLVPFEPVASTSDGRVSSNVQVRGQVHPSTSLPRPAISSPPRPFTNPKSPNISPSQSQAVIPLSSSTPRQSSTTPVFKQSCWSISHNPNIKQAFDIDPVKTINCHPARVACVKFSPDGKYLGVGLDQWSGKTYIYDTEKGLTICSLMDLSLKDQPTVWAIEFSPDSKCIAIASSDSRIRLWEIARKRMRSAFTNHLLSASIICFSQNGRSLVACDGGSVRIWSVRDGSSKRLIHDAPNISSVTFSPDGRHIASVEAGGWLRICKARTGQLLDRWRAHTRNVLHFVFSPDGGGLVSVGENKILRYWDVSSLAVIPARGRMTGTPGQRFPQIREFAGHMSWIRSVSFSPDNRWMVTSSLDQSIRIWDPQTAECHCVLHGHDGAYAKTVDFGPAGKYLAGGGRHQVRIWRFRNV